MTFYEENKNSLTLSMAINKQYKFEVYNRNSFSDEQKKEKRTLIIFAIVMILVVAFLFIRTAYLYKIQFEEKVEGILLNKKLGKKSLITIEVFNAKTISLTKYYYHNKYEYGDISTFEKLQIGDSVFKHSNSHIVKLYRKKNDVYVYIDSFNIKVW